MPKKFYDLPGVSLVFSVVSMYIRILLPSSFLLFSIVVIMIIAFRADNGFYGWLSFQRHSVGAGILSSPTDRHSAFAVPPGSHEPADSPAEGRSRSARTAPERPPCRPRVGQWWRRSRRWPDSWSGPSGTLRALREVWEVQP